MSSSGLLQFRELNLLCESSRVDPGAQTTTPRITKSVIETVIQEEASQLPVVETSFELPVVSPRIRPLTNTPAELEYDSADYERQVSMSVFEAEDQV